MKDVIRNENYLFYLFCESGKDEGRIQFVAKIEVKRILISYYSQIISNIIFYIVF